MSNQADSGSVIFAKSVPALARFYEGVLGARVVHADADHVVLAVGGTQLVVHGIPQHIAGQIAVATPPVLREDTAIKPFFTVRALAAARAAAAALGGGMAPTEREWSAPGFRACDGWDPEGNVVQFRERTA